MYSSLCKSEKSVVIVVVVVHYLRGIAGLTDQMTALTLAQGAESRIKFALRTRAKKS